MNLELTKEILEANGFEFQSFISKINDVVLVSLFYKIVSIRNQEELIMIKDQIISCDRLSSEIRILKAIIFKEMKITLNDEQTERILVLLKAYFRRGSVRTKLDVSSGLYNKQGGKCNICNCDISASYCIDHIIPFKYVGDQLDNNYQLLCNNCNQAKKANVFYELIYFVSIGSI